MSDFRRSWGRVSAAEIFSWKSWVYLFVPGKRVRGWSGGGGGRYSLAEWSARRTCYPQAVPASSPSPTTSLTCLFCRPKFKSTATLANNQLVFSCNWGSCYGFYWIIFFYSFEWSPSRTAGKISALPLWTDRYLYLYSQLPASGQLVIIFNPVIICLWLFEYRACFFRTLKCSIIICFISKTEHTDKCERHFFSLILFNYWKSIQSLCNGSSTSLSNMFILQIFQNYSDKFCSESHMKVFEVQSP